MPIPMGIFERQENGEGMQRGTREDFAVPDALKKEGGKRGT